MQGESLAFKNSEKRHPKTRMKNLHRFLDSGDILKKINALIFSQQNSWKDVSLTPQSDLFLNSNHKAVVISRKILRKQNH